MGGDSAEALAGMFAFAGEVVCGIRDFCDAEEGGWGACSRGTRGHELRELLSLSIRASKQFGWLSKSRAYEREQAGEGRTYSTCARCLDNLDPRRLQELRKACPEQIIDSPTEQDQAEADEAISYFAELSVSERDNDLTRNLHIIAANGFASIKSAGLACAMRVCFEVAQRRKEGDEKAAAVRAASQHVGTIKKRGTFTATVQHVFRNESQWGVSVKTILHDDAGNVLVAKELVAEREGEEGAPSEFLDVQRGDKVSFVATVAEHAEYKGTKQTKLLRAKGCKFVSMAV